MRLWPSLTCLLESISVWLSQLQIARLFQTSKETISKHIQAIVEDGKLDEQATVNQQLTVQTERRREVPRKVIVYNLKATVVVGFCLFPSFGGVAEG